ncbi:MAG TPA: PfkB family carbohydrate kinase [Ktedonobacterales bacterium]|jgi:sugar/nucleoside kinase (ribokinase family)
MSESETAPEFVVVGHASRDLLPDGTWRLGGGVSYAGVAAGRLGLRVGVLTSAPPDVLAALRAALPNAAIVNVPASEATTFENIYDATGRRQFLRARAESLTLDHLPPTWAEARIVLLAPVAQEVDPSFAQAFLGALVAAAPQGWLRRWDAQGTVSPGPLDVAPQLLPHVRALILSRDDLLLLNADAEQKEQADTVIATWASRVPFVAVTRGSDGADLCARGAPAELFPGMTAHEIDPTGAGDVFAAAFLGWLDRTGDARAAVRFANHVAACSVERVGVESAPTIAQLVARFPDADFTLLLGDEDQSASSN